MPPCISPAIRVGMSPASAWASVDFPHPDAPVSRTTSPDRIVRLIDRSTGFEVPAYRNETLSIRTVATMYLFSPLAALAPWLRPATRQYEADDCDHQHYGPGDDERHAVGQRHITQI